VAVVRPRVRTAAAIAGLVLFGVVFTVAGIWQLRRADENSALAAQFAAGTDAVPLTEPPAALTDANRFHRVAVEGAYVPAPQFLLDNMLHEGVAGYHVLTVMRVADSTRRLIVNRGWIAAGSDRRVLPDVGVATGPRTITGRIERLPRPGMRLGRSSAAPAAPTTETVAVVEYPTMAELSAKLDQPLFDYQLLLDPAAPGGYARDWLAPGVGPERNWAYAGQWFVFAVGALGAAITLAIRSARLQP